MKRSGTIYFSSISMNSRLAGALVMLGCLVQLPTRLGLGTRFSVPEQVLGRVKCIEGVVFALQVCIYICDL